MLLVRRGEGFAGAGDGLSVSGAELTRDAISPGSLWLAAVVVMFVTAERLGKAARAAGAAKRRRQKINCGLILSGARH